MNNNIETTNKNPDGVVARFGFAIMSNRLVQSGTRMCFTQDCSKLSRMTRSDFQLRVYFGASCGPTKLLTMSAAVREWGVVSAREVPSAQQ